MKQESSKKGLQERGTRRHPGHSHGPRTRRALFVHFPRSKCSITQRPCEASICYPHSANEETEALTHEGSAGEQQSRGAPRQPSPRAQAPDHRPVSAPDGTEGENKARVLALSICLR